MDKPKKKIKFIVKPKKAEPPKKKKIKFVVKPKPKMPTTAGASEKPKKKIKFIVVSSTEDRKKEMKTLMQQGIDLMFKVQKKTKGFINEVRLASDLDKYGFTIKDYKIPKNLYKKSKSGGNRGMIIMTTGFPPYIDYIKSGLNAHKKTTKKEFKGDISMFDDGGILVYYNAEVVNNKLKFVKTNQSEGFKKRERKQIVENEE